MEKNKFTAEWCLLQNQFDSYEKHSLYIKLLSVFVFFTADILDVTSKSIVFILGVLWLQDAIWKTFQSRIEPRLFQIEKNISDESSENECQFNSEYHKVRLSGKSLIFEYFWQSIRPTIAFPHVVLIFIFLMKYIP